MSPSGDRHRTPPGDPGRPGRASHAELPAAELPAAEVAAVERDIRRVLAFGTWLGIGLLATGVSLMLVNGISPTEAFAPFDLAQVLPDVLAGRPDGFLWAGIVVFIATPVARVVGELVLYVRGREWTMTVVALAILGVVALSLLVALTLEI